MRNSIVGLLCLFIATIPTAVNAAIYQRAAIEGVCADAGQFAADATTQLNAEERARAQQRLIDWLAAQPARRDHLPGAGPCIFDFT